MITGRIPGVAKGVSRLIQGTVMLASKKERAGFDLFDAIFNAGCNAFDTAHVYGNGDVERTLGHWINTRNIRDEVVLITKGGHHNADRKRVTPFDIAADLHDSLARLNTDFIDLYLLHRDDPRAPVGPIMEALNGHKAAGRIHAFGASNWSAARVAEANAYAKARGLTPFAASSPHFSLAEQMQEPWPDCVSIAGPSAAPQREWYARTRMPVLCWSSLAAGWFSGRLARDRRGGRSDALCMRCYESEANWRRLERAETLAAEKGRTVAQLALAYIFAQSFDAYALVAARTPEEFADCAAAADAALTADEAAWLNLERERP